MPRFEDLISQLTGEFERLAHENCELRNGNAALRLRVEPASEREGAFDCAMSAVSSGASSPRKSFHSVWRGSWAGSGDVAKAPVPTCRRSLQEPEPHPEGSPERLGEGGAGAGAGAADDGDDATQRPGTATGPRTRLSLGSSLTATMMGSALETRSGTSLSWTRLLMVRWWRRKNWLSVIHPEEDAFLQRWNVVAVLALAFVAVVAPVQVAILKGDDPEMLFVANCIVDLAFLIDLGLQFLIMYPRPTDYGFEWERCHKRIATNYLRTWFVIDLVSVIPFDLLNKFASAESGREIKVIKVIRLLRLLKLARLLKASRLLRRVEVSTSISYGQMDLLKFFAFLSLLTHWLANFWALTLVVVDESDGVPRWIDVFAEQDKDLVLKTKDTPWKLYLTCFYFVSYTLTSVGYGDIGPANIVETVVLTVIVVVAGTAWAVVLAQVCSILSNLSSREQAFRQTMDELNSMMKDRSIPANLQQRLRSFFLSNKTAQQRAKHASLIASMSPGLRGEVVMAMNQRWIANVSFLKQFMVESTTRRGAQRSTASAFILEVVQQMQSAVHAQSELFGERQELYMLNCGLVSHGIRLRRTGSVWGNDFVLSDTSLIESPQCFALTYVELTTLKRDKFLPLVEKYRTTYPELQRRVRRFCCWLAFQRAIKKEARRRQRRQKRMGGIPWSASRVSFAVPVNGPQSPFWSLPADSPTRHGVSEQWGSAEQWGVPAEAEDGDAV